MLAGAGIKHRPTTTKNPQANAVIERVHQTLGSMVRSFAVHQMENLDESDPWSGILTAVAFAVRSTIHTTLQATPAQLVFGRDMVLPVDYETDWNEITKRNNAKGLFLKTETVGDLENCK